jgi:hypothetical protein
VGDSPFVPPPIVVNSSLPDVKLDGKTGSLPLSSAASYAWSAFIALNWPASTAANTRGVPDTGKPFGQPGTPTWITMRSKNELFPGNATPSMPPHGVVLDPVTRKPINGPDYGYGDAPQYQYPTGRAGGLRRAQRRHVQHRDLLLALRLDHSRAGWRRGIGKLRGAAVYPP